jgi:hypothetical protein
MSSSIWTHEELLASTVAIETTAWRVVEAQHCVSTMKLVDTLAEQKVLEDLLEETKPPIPPIPEGMSYLLFTPFRYTARNGFSSRFRRGNSQDGVFYASASPETAIAEMAFYRKLFFAESPETPMPSNPAEFTAFAVQIRTECGLDLTRAPLNNNHAAWTDAQDYSQCHDLAEAARNIGVEVIAYPSIRDFQHRLNYAVLTPAAFAQVKPITQQTWRIHIREDGGVLAKCEAPRIGLSFSNEDFDIASRLKAADKKVA